LAFDYISERKWKNPSMWSTSDLFYLLFQEEKSRVTNVRGRLRDTLSMSCMINVKLRSCFWLNLLFKKKENLLFV